MQNLFLQLVDSDKSPYELKAEAQIEPVHPEDPEEIYRMRRRRTEGLDGIFDVVFYPDRAEIRGADQNILIGEIRKENVESPADVARRLEAMLPHIVEATNHRGF